MKRTSLKRKTPLRSKTPLKRKTRLKPVSDKRLALQAKRRTFVREQLDARPHCEAGPIISKFYKDNPAYSSNGIQLMRYRCNGNSVDIHEPLTRARGGSIVDVDNSMAVCRMCHDWIHHNPQLATDLHLLKRANID
jgi:hypothetical protein